MNEIAKHEVGFPTNVDELRRIDEYVKGLKSRVRGIRNALIGKEVEKAVVTPEGINRPGILGALEDFIVDINEDMGI